MTVPCYQYVGFIKLKFSATGIENYKNGNIRTYSNPSRGIFNILIYADNLNL